MDIELVTEGLRFPEGPIAMADGSVILTEIEGQALTRVLPDGRKETVSETGGGPNGAAIGPDGAIYVTNNGGSFEFMKTNGLNIPGPTPPSHQGGYIQRVDIASGKCETIYDTCEGRRFAGPLPCAAMRNSVAIPYRPQKSSTRRNSSAWMAIYERCLAISQDSAEWMASMQHDSNVYDRRPSA